MNVRIQPVNAQNEHSVRQLKVAQNQQHFIETVDECLAEAKTTSNWQPVAIYDESQLVGFAMYGSFGENKDTWIDRLLIDEKYQGKGYGRAAMELLLKIVPKQYGVDHLYLSLHEGNTVARKLYERLGFTYMNERDPSNDELMFIYNCIK